jgi:hypothetical protein
VCCGARARVWRRIRCTGQAWMEFVFPCMDRYTSKQVSITTKAQVRFEKYIADELLLHGQHPLGSTRYTVHASIYRVSMLHELGANVPIQSRCGASLATPRREIDCITWQCKGAYRYEACMRRPYVSRNQHPRVSHLFLHLHVRSAAVPVFPGGVAWPFWPFSLSFSTSGAGFSPFWVGASV